MGFAAMNKLFSFLDQVVPGQSGLRYIIHRCQTVIPAILPERSTRIGVILYGDALDARSMNRFQRCVDEQLYRATAVFHAADLPAAEVLGRFDYLCFVEHGCLLHVNALALLLHEAIRDDCDLVYADEDQLLWGVFRCRPFYKPGIGKYLLWSKDYITSFFCLKVTPEVVDALCTEGVSKKSLYTLLLDLEIWDKKTMRVPHILSHRSRNSRRIVNTYSTEAVEDYLERKELLQRVRVTSDNLQNRLLFTPSPSPLVSIIIPFKDKVNLTRQCVCSIESSSYRNFEIILVDNRSVEKETACYLENSPHTVIRADIDFNYSQLNNIGVAAANGDYLVLMNNDIEVITHDWLENLIGLAEFPDVGAVAPKLLYPNGTIQHAGMVLTQKKGAKHVNRNLRGDKGGYANYNVMVREYLAFTGACIALSRRKFLEVGGFDEELAIISNDVDLCLRLYERGYVNVFNPNVMLYHYESASRKGQKKGTRGDNLRLFGVRWRKYFGNDPYYNPNLSQQRKDFAVRVDIS